MLHVREILLSANSRFVVIFIRRGWSRGFVRAKRLSIQETRARGRILWIPLTNSALSPNSNKRGRGYKLCSAIFARPTAFRLSPFVPKKRKKKRRRRRSFHLESLLRTWKKRPRWFLSPSPRGCKLCAVRARGFEFRTLWCKFGCK